MANHKSAEKRNRQTARRNEVNSVRKNRIKGYLKKVEAAIASGNRASANQALKDAQPEIMRGVSKGVLKLTTASRKISRLSSRIKQLAA